MAFTGPLFTINAHPEMVDFGSRQGPSEFASAGLVRLFRGMQMRENAAGGRKTLFLDGHYLQPGLASAPQILYEA